MHIELDNLNHEVIEELDTIRQSFNCLYSILLFLLLGCCFVFLFYCSSHFLKVSARN